MRAKRIDANQNEIVNQLRKIGASVFITSMVGKGFPDIVVGLRGINFLIELKDSSKPNSAKKLTADEQAFFDTWQGTVYKCETFHEILQIISKQYKI
jgi:Holliday junction resolvase